MILSSADILQSLGGSEIIRLAARLKIVDKKPALSGDEYLYVCELPLEIETLLHNCASNKYVSLDMMLIYIF